MISDVAQMGTGMLAMFVNLNDEWQEEFRIWLQENMFTARLNIGFHACASYDLVNEANGVASPSPYFLTVYETASLGVLYSEPYQDLRCERNQQDAAFHERFRDTERYTLAWVGPELAGGKPGFSKFVYVDRFDLNVGKAQQFNQWFVNVYLPACEEIKSLVRVRRYTAVEGSPRIFIFHEFEDSSALAGKDWITLRGNQAWTEIEPHLGGSGAYERVISAP